jgi:hypothetical protein
MRGLVVPIASAGVALMVVLAVAACGGTGQLLRAHTPARSSTSTTTVISTPHPVIPPPRSSSTAQRPSAESLYLARLGTEQTKLANAEQAIPTNPRTPAALAHSVDLLNAAVRGLADGLAAINPPAAVAADHARLITIMRGYAAQLSQAARIVVGPGGERRAGALLISATDQASRSFTATIDKIDSTLGNSQ